MNIHEGKGYAQLSCEYRCLMFTPSLLSPSYFVYVSKAGSVRHCQGASASLSLYWWPMQLVPTSCEPAPWFCGEMFTI